MSPRPVNYLLSVYIFGKVVIIAVRHHDLLTTVDMYIFLVRGSPSPASVAISYCFPTCSLTSLQTFCGKMVITIAFCIFSVVITTDPHWRLVPAQDGTFFCTRSHLSALQNCVVLFSTNFQILFILKKCVTQFSH